MRSGKRGAAGKYRAMRGAEMKSSEQNRNQLTRRDLLGTASLAGLGTALLSSPELRAQEQQAYQTGKDPGKHEPIADFKFDLEATRGWVGEAGSAKEATMRNSRRRNTSPEFRCG